MASSMTCHPWALELDWTRVRVAAEVRTCPVLPATIADSFPLVLAHWIQLTGDLCEVILRPAAHSMLSLQHSSCLA